MRYFKAIPRKVTPETALKRDIRRLLSLKGWRTVPILQGMGAYKGIADIYAFKGAQSVWIEVKRPKGIQSPHQVAFQQILEAEGIPYLLARSVDDVIKFLGLTMHREVMG